MTEHIIIVDQMALKLDISICHVRIQEVLSEGVQL